MILNCEGLVTLEAFRGWNLFLGGTSWLIEDSSSAWSPTLPLAPAALEALRLQYIGPFVPVALFWGAWCSAPSMEESEGHSGLKLLEEGYSYSYGSIRTGFALQVLFLLLKLELIAGSRKFLLIKMFSLFFIVSCCF